MKHLGEIHQVRCGLSECVIRDSPYLPLGRIDVQGHVMKVSAPVTAQFRILTENERRHLEAWGG